MAVVQILSTGAVLLLLYRFLLATIGIQRLGIWSIILSTTSVINIANMGLSASVVKFVAKYKALEDESTVTLVIETSALVLGLIVGTLLFGAYPIAYRFLGFVTPAEMLAEARVVLPYALLSFWITVIGSVFQAGLDGYQRTDIRSLLVSSSSVVLLGIAVLTVPRYGLAGLAYAQVAQSALLAFASWIMLKREVSTLRAFPRRLDWHLLRNLLAYGFSYQVISISQLLYDPVTKALLATFGGLSMVGFYEMASRMILQVRAVVVAANQVLVPTIAHLYETSRESLGLVYRDSFRMVLFVTPPIFAVLVAFTPIISRVWIGHYEGNFVFCSWLLSLAWFVNMLSVPAYFDNLGTGFLRSNTLVHVIIGVSNLGLGWIFGRMYGGKGVVIGWAVSLSLGSLVIPIVHHYSQRIAFTELLPRRNFGVILASVASILVCLSLYRQLNNHLSLVGITGILLLVCGAILIIPLWRHPMRKRSLDAIRNELLVAHA